MRFTITEEYQHGLQLIRITDHQAASSVAVLPLNGASLHEWMIPMGSGLINVIDNYPDRDTLSREFSKWYKGAKLSPFVCRIKEGRYRWQGQDYEFPHKFFDGSAIHGLLFNKPFTVSRRECLTDHAHVGLSYRYEQEDAGYPFYYQCDITYTLEAGNRLQISTEITNSDHQPIPVADGWHPYFSLGGPIDTWLLHLDAQQLFEFDAQLVPTGTYLRTDQHRTPAPIGQAFFDNSFVLNFSENQSAATLYNPNNKLKLSCFPDKSYPILQIFTPPGRTSIAMENLSGAPNCFNNGIGLITLQPGETKTFKTTFVLDVMGGPE